MIQCPFCQTTIPAPDPRKCAAISEKKCPSCKKSFNLHCHVDWWTTKPAPATNNRIWRKEDLLEVL